MGIIADIGGILVAGGSGGLLGVFGSGVNRVMGFFEKKEDRKHAIKLAELKAVEDERLAKISEAKDLRNHAHEIRLHELNADAAQHAAETAILAMREKGSWEGFAESQKAAAVEAENFKGSKWVEDYKATTRPNLTYMLWLLVLICFWFVPSELRVQIIGAAVFCATASTMWWFGDRAPKYKALPMGFTMDGAA